MNQINANNLIFRWFQTHCTAVDLKNYMLADEIINKCMQKQCGYEMEIKLLPKIIE